MREIKCNECGVVLAELEKGSRIRKDVKIYCEPCYYGINEGVSEGAIEGLSEGVGEGLRSLNNEEGIKQLRKLFGMD